MTKGKKIFAVIGYGLVGLMVVGFLLHIILQIKSGYGGAIYLNSKHQPNTYIGALISFGIIAALGLVALYYRVKRVIERKRKLKETRSN